MVYGIIEFLKALRAELARERQLLITCIVQQ